MKDYIIISGLNLSDNNRGTAALSYGAFSFLKEKGLLQDSCKLITYRFVLNPFKKSNRSFIKEAITVQGTAVEYMTVNVPRIEKYLFDKFNISLPFTAFGKTLRQIKYVAAINGGDGFSDIYDTKSFFGRLNEINLAMKANIPVIILPQTIGPFEHESNRRVADEILKYAERVYVRDNKFIGELDKLGIAYEQTKDLSYYMQPEPFNIDIKENAVGINVSGLTYSNKYRTLSGQFENYPYLIKELIKRFLSENVHVYLIPHSYCCSHPEVNNDDIEACREAYKDYIGNPNVTFIDKDLISPNVKYVISKMTYFVGTRMHANFAAIYTGVPLYGLAYSYKFEGAFKANGVYDNNVTMINNATMDECDTLVEKIICHYHKSISHATI